MILSLLLAVVSAEEPAPPPAPAPVERRRRRATFRASGHVKTFGFVAFGKPVEGLPDDLLHDALNPLPEHPTGQGIVDARLNLAVAVGPVRVEAAHAVTTFLDADGTTDDANAEVVAALAEDPLGALGDLAQLGSWTSGLSSGGGGGGLFSAGVGLNAPELIPLTWRVGQDPLRDVRLQGRTDRLLVKLALPAFDLTIGRQPVTFGSGLFFTPLDLVSPFSPATVDSEYKPGVDAVRLDGYFGTSGAVTVVVAYTGRTYVYEDAAEGESAAARVTAAATARATVGVTDLSAFLGAVRGDLVVGASVQSSAGPVGLHGDVAVTFPAADLDESPFVRAVVGVDGRPTGTTTLMGELYVQSFGTTDAGRLFEVLSSPRVARGEVWLTGLAYAGLSVTQEITPLLVGTIAGFVNLTDPSALIAPSLSWSAAQSVDVAIGGFVGVGAAPEGRALDPSAVPDDPTVTDLAVIVPRSELGTYPANVFVKVAASF